MRKKEPDARRRGMIKKRGLNLVVGFADLAALLQTTTLLHPNLFNLSLGRQGS